MNFPGFTAQVSLYDSPRRYRSATTSGQPHHSLNPAALVLPAACNQLCRIGCKGACTQACKADFTGPKRGACLRECEVECSVDCGCKPIF